MTNNYYRFKADEKFIQQRLKCIDEEINECLKSQTHIRESFLHDRAKSSITSILQEEIDKRIEEYGKLKISEKFGQKSIKL